MSINSSTNLSVPATFPSPNLPVLMHCGESGASSVIYYTYTLTNILFLFPLYILVLHTGFKQWRRQRSAPAGTMSHSDFFTFNMMAVELLGVLESAVLSFSNFTRNTTLLMSGLMLFSVTVPGQILFHILTCVDRYLAAVHPVRYMHLRERFGVSVRNVVTVCVWLLCFGWLGLGKFEDFKTFYSFLALVGVSTCVSLFFCVAVIRVLTRPGPGEAGRRHDRADQSKQRALHIICSVTAVLLLRFVGLVISMSLHSVADLSPRLLCPLLDSGVWFLVPSSLVLPLLFLHRAGKLTCCRSGSESGRRGTVRMLPSILVEKCFK